MFNIKGEKGKTEMVEEKAFWHTSAHLLAYAVKNLYGNVLLAIGPSIENGFYYDLDRDEPFSEKDLEDIENEMRNIVKKEYPMEHFTMPREEAIKMYKERGEKYKLEILDGINDEEVSFYSMGEFIDLCKGPHINNIKNIKAIKLLSISGAYWRGSEKNKMLQRIYGITFPKKSMLDEYLEKLEDAKNRDHRKIAKDQKLFLTHELVGAGLPMYLPNGATIRRILARYIEDKELESGYMHLATPCIATTKLYKTSGHWDHYREDMFPIMKMDNEELVLRPMNCPHHMLIYKSELRSYRDLPIRYAELANDFRFEDSGSVCGIERVRSMTQNDSHIFLREDQISSVFKEVINLILDTYKDFNIKDYTFRLSLRDKDNKEKYYNNDQMWENAENQLRTILTNLNIPFYEAIGEAAFYGPKLDIQIKTALGHDITISTCQLDFLLPERFELEYIKEDGTKGRPVVIHRAILGTLDRFMAYIIEELKGKFPLWLAPVQFKIITISNEQEEYAKKIEKILRKNHFRVELDLRDEKMGRKIREAQLSQIPYMLIIGKNEVEKDILTIRLRDNNENVQMNIQDLVIKAKEKEDTKSFDLNF